MRLIIQLFIAGLLLISFPFSALSVPNESVLTQSLKQAENDKNTPKQGEIVDALQSALNWVNERKTSLAKTRQYQQSINDFPRLTRSLQQQLKEESEPVPSTADLSAEDAEQQILQLSSKLLEVSRQLQQELDRSREITESLSQVPQKQLAARKALSEIERRLQLQIATDTPLAQAINHQLATEQAARQTQLDELELEQLSANNRQELSRLQIEVLRKRHDRLDGLLNNLKNSLNNQRQRKAEQALARTQELVESVEQNGNLPKSISEQLEINRELSQALNQQALQMDNISKRQRATANQTIQVNQALSTILEQAQWLSESAALSDSLRAQVSRLPDMPKPQQIDNDMAKLRVQRLNFDNLLNKIAPVSSYRQNDGKALNENQQRLLSSQLNSQRDLLNSLISGCDTQILEFTKLKVANTQLIEALTEVKDATHRYLFWAADVEPIGLSFPLDILHSLNQLLSLDTLSQLSKAMLMMVTSKETLIPLFGALLLVGVSIYSRRYHNAYLERDSSKIGKVTQDNFMLTLRTLVGSILAAIPLPILWAAVGYGLRNAWPYPMAVAIGEGVTAALPVLWAFMISNTLSRPNGLFIAHFGWGEKQVNRGMRYYKMSIWLIVPLIMALATFDHMDDRVFNASLGRACFLMLCVALGLLTLRLKRAGIPLYLNKEGSGENIPNYFFWGILLSAPLIAMLASLLGYLNTAQVLLARLESSVGIWFILLIVYYTIRRWMLIQRRKLTFERAKQRRAERLEKRNEENVVTGSIETNIEIISDSEVDIDAISAQSLQLIRFILTMVALVAMIWLWSELHSAFAFLENIHLWDVSTTVQGVNSVQPITLGSVLIAILVLIVTIQLITNLPSLLELTLLQHIDLSPGTGYAITTITKYLLLLLGGIIAFSMLGIEWSKLQWLVAALTFGLGFGLQEIFSNFISGLIILFEKPIRIGDTVTIRDLTGTVSRINTRATTIADWDRKEIIVPNKAFITEQFINWSLSDGITRVVLTIPAEIQANSETVTQILLEAASKCALVLDNPPAEAYLIDIQQGLQLFELRIYAADMSHRLPLRHEIHQMVIAGYKAHNLVLPFPPFQISSETLYRGRENLRRVFKEGGV